jgi:hypothetical protein
MPIESIVRPIVGCHAIVAPPTIQGTAGEASTSMETYFTSCCLAMMALNWNMSQYDYSSLSEAHETVENV